jgi:tRNA pseudouridine38-40 synthase
VRYFFHIGFNGRNYRGWQRQAKAHNVQQVMEEALSQILKSPTFITGCGRTDAQVHASQFFFHVDIETPWDFDLVFRVNKTLPDDIAVFDIFPVSEFDHARFAATARTYDYFIHTYKNPFLSAVSTLYLEKSLNLEKMKQAVSLLPLYHDYRALCKSPDSYRTTICKITSAQLMIDDNGDHIRFQVTADRFLGKMIRIIVGKLLLIGRSELSVDEFESYLITKKTPETFEPAFAQGLYLSKVTYPFLDTPPRSDFSSIIQGQVDSWQVV